MKLLVTGAFGFLGQRVVSESLFRGHEVIALARSPHAKCSFNHESNSAFRILELDLLNTVSLTQALKDFGVDAVVHLAASMCGSFSEKYRDTVAATESLIKAMCSAHVGRLVLTSSFSVFDYLNIPKYSNLDESSPTDKCPQLRDGYARLKLIQEERCWEFQQKHGADVTVLRLGVIYGANRLWTARLGIRLSSNKWIQVSSDIHLPLTYVENCAMAIVQSVVTEESANRDFNIVDDNLPTQQDYIERLVSRFGYSRCLFSIDWKLLESIAINLRTTNRALSKVSFKLPGVMEPANLHARFKPLNFSNSRAKSILSWSPKYSIDESFNRIEAENLILNQSKKNA